MSHYKPYPAYKDSGVEWLGRVPEHWAAKKLMYWISTGYGSGTTPSDESYYINDESGVAWVTTGELRENTINRTEKYVTEHALASHSALKVHPVGSLVIAMYGATIGRLGVLGIEATLNQACFAIHPSSVITTPFLRYWFEGFRSELIELGTGGGQPNVSADKIRNLVVPAPCSDDEQNAVTLHLDRETARIDALINRKTRFIELLREKRQALITHAVTKGLDPSVKMKDSGVEWLGEVPEHWDALPLRRVVTAVKTGGTPSNEPPSLDVEGLAWYTPGDFGNSLVLGVSEKRVSSQAVTTGEAKVYPAGSVMVVSIGATLGKVGFLFEAASANQQINAVIPNARVDGYFLAYSLSVKTEAMWFLANAATIGIMNQEKTKEIWVAIPSVAEQMGIGAYLDRETSRIDRLVGKTERSIELLKERRSALITAAVTGQIDLRETA